MELRWPSWLSRRSRSGRLSQLNPSAFQNSTLAELAWQRARHASTRWALWGAVVGVFVGLVLFAPASWLAYALSRASDQRLLLADAQGTVWNGSAQVVLTGGAGSRDASALPGRLQWQLRPRFNGMELRLNQECCLDREMLVQVRFGWGRYQIILPAQPQALGQWPAAWLGGLGTPFNTMQLGGTARLVSPGLTIESVQGRVLVSGRADLDLVGVSSRVTTLETLGSYRMSLSGDPANPGVSLLNLTTTEGALQLNGTGSWGPSGVRFRGEASAGAADESALSNLLNIIGRRSGARSVISIG